MTPKRSITITFADEAEVTPNLVDIDAAGIIHFLADEDLTLGPCYFYRFSEDEDGEGFLHYCMMDADGNNVKDEIGSLVTFQDPLRLIKYIEIT